MKVLFKKHVINVGKPGEVKEVKPGYAQNFLFPQGNAVEFTPALAKSIKNSERKQEAHRRELVENRHDIVDILNGQSLQFSLKTGANNKVYGGIGEKDILQSLYKKFKIELTKKHIDLLDGHLKKLGIHDVYIKVGKDAIAKIKVEIIAEENKG